MNIRSVFIRKK